MASASRRPSEIRACVSLSTSLISRHEICWEFWATSELFKAAPKRRAHRRPMGARDRWAFASCHDTRDVAVYHVSALGGEELNSPNLRSTAGAFQRTDTVQGGAIKFRLENTPSPIRYPPCPLSKLTALEVRVRRPRRHQRMRDRGPTQPNPTPISLLALPRLERKENKRLTKQATGWLSFPP